MGKLNVLLLVPLALVLLAPAVSAADANGEGKYISGAYGSVKCLTDFEKGVISSITSAVPGATNLSQWSTTLDSDTAQLKSYADSGDKDGFRAYLKGTYEPDVKSANQAIRDARKNFREWNVSASAKKDMLDGYKDAKDDLTSCHLSSVKGMAQGRVSHYEDVLEKYTEKADNLSAKGLDSSGMMSVISGARSTVVDPLDAALGAATTGKEVADAVKGYCLSNGCRNGINYHFYARFEHAKLQAMLDYIKPNATAAGLGADAVQSDLDSIKTKLDSIGTSAYSSGQESEVWAGLKGVARDIKAMMRDLRGNSTSAGSS